MPSETIIFSEWRSCTAPPTRLTRKIIGLHSEKMKCDPHSALTVTESTELDCELTIGYMDRQASKDKQSVLGDLRFLAETDERLGKAKHIPLPD